jgi:hypothetical protein
MAVRTRDELLGSMRSVMGESLGDEALALIEDVTDTLTDYDSRIGEDWKKQYEENNAAWEKKYNDNDTAWRQKYRDRFFGGETPERGATTPAAVIQDNADDLRRESDVKSFDDLFKEREHNNGY